MNDLNIFANSLICLIDSGESENLETIENNTEQFEKSLEEIAVYNAKLADNLNNQNDREFNTSQKVFGLVFLISVVVGNLFAIIISKSITRPLALQ